MPKIVVAILIKPFESIGSESLIARIMITIMPSRTNSGSKFISVCRKPFFRKPTMVRIQPAIIPMDL